MPDRHIVCVKPAAGSGDTVVVEVQQEGSHVLDVRLVGCEGENPYVATIKQRNLAKLKHKFKGSDEEWASILSHFILQKPVLDATKSDLLDGVRLVYTLKDDLTLSFRQDVQGIKVTLGEIVLPRNDEFEFNPFDWAQASAQAHAQTLQELADLKARASTEQVTIAKLNAQLDHFIKTKDETETAMLQQFMELLNEKKRKIRDQSRLLASATVDSSVAAAVQTSRQKPRKAGSSRRAKRKTPAQPAESEPDSDQMEIDEAKVEEQDDEEPAHTPDPSDDETDGEETAAPQAREKSPETLRSSSVVAKEESQTDGKPPPKRELPFGRPATRSNQLEQPSSPAKEDDETDDEEL
ncbi:hypothetical protein EK21DRAFT_58594 [Setomelanomma holmii]|uniref:XRCC4 coiled-coil domain-containing protein n=1 Tax=Setomelanomma holmii TaxID=210430 RepID=A0A9P4LQT2_9PLEO|nr:hypothetical protein EK21DRAFT_58594 [Setomelanomma holmii]